MEPIAVELALLQVLLDIGFVYDLAFRRLICETVSHLKAVHATLILGGLAVRVGGAIAKDDDLVAGAAPLWILTTATLCDLGAALFHHGLELRHVEPLPCASARYF